MATNTFVEKQKRICVNNRRMFLVPRLCLGMRSQRLRLDFRVHAGMSRVLKNDGKTQGSAACINLMGFFGILHMGTKVVYTLCRRLGCAGANVG